MKKVNLNDKLNLKKEQISNLTDVKGGGADGLSTQVCECLRWDRNWSGTVGGWVKYNPESAIGIVQQNHCIL